MSARTASLLLASILTLSGGAKTLPRGLAEPSGSSGCESFGPGFVKAEGSGTCVKLSGAVRAEYGYTTSGASTRR